MSENPPPDAPPPPPSAPPAPFLGMGLKPSQMGKNLSFAQQISGNKVAASATSTQWHGLQDDKFFGEKKCELTGLSNQGATCYLNSLIQSLFMTPELRKVLYRWKYDPQKDGPKQFCIPYQLQKLFAELQMTHKVYVDTKDLTKSFRWTDHDAFQQHDVQELLRVLLEALEKCFSHSAVVNNSKDLVLEGLYQGLSEDYLECTVCHTARSSLIEFFDLQLVVSGNDSIEKALKAYIEPELMDNDNKVFCEKCDCRQNSLKGIKFRELPYLLCLQLKRFDFDYQTMQRVKINSRCSFPYDLNMAPYVDQTTDLLNYELFAILIASGGAMGGHYFTYIKNLENNKFYTFDDTTVRELEKPEEEIEKMFGTNPAPENDPDPNKPYVRRGHGTSAYMLLYRLKSDKNVTSVTIDEIPKDILEEIQKENEEYLKEKAKYIERKESYPLRILYKDEQPKIITLHKSKTLEEATKLAYDTIFPEGSSETPLDGVRLRDFNASKKVAGQSFSGKEKQSLASLDFYQNKTLLLETKEINGNFPAEDDFRLNIFLVDKEHKFNEIKSTPLTIKPDASLDALKRAVSEKTDIPVDMLLISKVHNAQTVDFIFEKENGNLKTDYGILDGQELYVESCADPQGSLVAKQVDEHQNLIAISFNHPNEDNWEREITIDKREPLYNLKERIAGILDIPSDQFKLCRKLIKFEYKDLNQTCDDVGLFDNSAVLILNGTPLTVSQFKIKFMLYEMNKIEPWKYHSTLVIDVSSKIDDIKPLLLTGDLESIDLNDKILRLRDKQGARPGKVLQDDKTLKQSFSRIYDDLEIAIQVISLSELGTTYAFEVSPSALVIEVQKWSPSKWEFDAKSEMSIRNDLSVAEFRREIATKFNAVFEHTLIAKPRPFQLKDVSNIPLLPWEVDDCCSLTGTPLHVQNGDLLIFKDRLEQEKVDLDELIKQKKEAGQTTVPTDHFLNRPKVPEPSIKIHTRFDSDFKGDQENEEEKKD